MPNYRGVYVVRAVIATVTAAKTLIQIKAGATTPLDLIRAGFSIDSTVSDEAVAQIVRKSAAATVTTFTPLEHNEDGPAADAVGGTAATGTNATVEGTDTDHLLEEAFNSLNGWNYAWLPDERIRVQPAGFIALKHELAITSAQVRCYMVFGEL
jgi:hypothetical protein